MTATVGNVVNRSVLDQVEPFEWIAVLMPYIVQALAAPVVGE
jgi:hypothetical protein